MIKSLIPLSGIRYINHVWYYCALLITNSLDVSSTKRYHLIYSLSVFLVLSLLLFTKSRPPVLHRLKMPVPSLAIFVYLNHFKWFSTIFVLDRCHANSSSYMLTIDLIFSLMTTFSPRNPHLCYINFLFSSL